MQDGTGIIAERTRPALADLRKRYVRLVNVKPVVLDVNDGQRVGDVKHLR